jgi:TP901-1 family phage major tail protein
MAKIAGVDVLMKVNVGDEETPEFVVLGGQTNATLSREAEEIDVSAKTDPAGYGDFLVGRKSWSIECEGFMVDSDASIDHLEQIYEARAFVDLELAYPSGKKYSGKGVITEFSLEFPSDDGATYSLTITGAGPLTPSN